MRRTLRIILATAAVSLGDRTLVSAAALSGGNVAALSAPTPDSSGRPVQLLLSGDAAASVTPTSADTQSAVTMGGGVGLSTQRTWLMLTINRGTAGSLTGTSYKDFSQALLLPSSSGSSATFESRLMRSCHKFNGASQCKDASWGLTLHSKLGASNVTISDSGGTAPPTFKSDATIYSVDVLFGVLVQAQALTGGSAFSLTAELGPILRALGGDIGTDEQSLARTALTGSGHTLLPGGELRVGFQLNNLGLSATVPFLARGGSLLHQGGLILSASIVAPIVLDIGAPQAQ